MRKANSAYVNSALVHFSKCLRAKDQFESFGSGNNCFLMFFKKKVSKSEN